MKPTKLEQAMLGMLDELRMACTIIRNARAVMSDAQADEWGRKNVQDGLGKVCSGMLETTRNTPRVNVIIRAEKALKEAAVSKRNHEPKADATGELA